MGNNCDVNHTAYKVELQALCERADWDRLTVHISPTWCYGQDPLLPPVQAQTELALSTISIALSKDTLR